MLVVCWVGDGHGDGGLHVGEGDVSEAERRWRDDVHVGDGAFAHVEVELLHFVVCIQSVCVGW